MVYVLAVAAALSNAVCSILQRMGVEDAPKEQSLKLSLIAHAIHRGVWLLGFLLLTAGFVLQALALHFGRLTEVQPILTTELLFLVFILGTWFRFHVGWREWIGALAAAGGLAGFLVFAAPSGGNQTPGGVGWAEVGGACAAIVAIAVVLATRGPRWWRAAMFGLSAAVGFAFCAALMKIVTDLIATDWLSMFWHWQTYALALCGLLSVFLAQNAYHAGPIAASQSTLVLVDPLASITIGIALFGDNLRTSGVWGPLEAVSLLVLFGGGVLLCQSPLIGGVKGEGEEYDEMLAGRSRLGRPRPAEAPTSA
jgi:drug/metabolite transporter (DMT)-like permease